MRRFIRADIRCVLFAALVSAGAATWLVLAEAPALTASTQVRPAGEAAMERVREAHALVATQSRADAEAGLRRAERAAAQMADARAAVIAPRPLSLAEAAPRRPAAAAQKPGPGPRTVVADANPPERPAGQPVNLAFVRLSPAITPATDEQPRRGLLGRIASAAGEIGAGAWGTLSAAARLPAQVLPSRFL